MRLLLDSHVFWWIATSSNRIPARIQQQILSAESLQLSIVSEWELLLKEQTGKLRPQTSVLQMVEQHLSATALGILPLDRRHLKRLATLAPHHRDPFDRLLIAQALHEQLTVVTHDRMFARYGLKILHVP